MFRIELCAFAFCLPLLAEDILIVDHPAYRSDPLNRRAVTEVVPGMPVVFRAGQATVTPSSSSANFSCLDPATVRFVLLPVGDTAEIELAPRRDSSCQIDMYSRLPDALPPGPLDAFLYDAAGRKFGPARLSVVDTHIGVLNRLDQSWSRMPAAAQMLALGAQPTIDLTHPARPGTLVELRVVGFGAADPRRLSVSLGQDRLDIFAAQADPREPGVHMVRFRLPEHPTEGCYVPLTLWTAERASNVTSLPVAATGPCKHRLPLKDEELARIDAGGTVAVGLLSLQDPINGPAATRIASLLVRRADAALLADLTGFDAPRPSGCTLSTDWFRQDRLEIQPPSDRFYDLLQTGRMSAVGPGNQQIDVVGIGFALGLPASMAPGQWRLRVEGSNVIAPFETDFRVPNHWLPDSPESLLTLTPGSDTELRWDATAMDPADDVAVTLLEGARTRLRCLAPAHDGRMTVDTARFQQALDAAAPQGRYNSLQYQIRANAAGMPTFRFPMADGTEGVGMVRVTVDNDYLIP